MPGNTFIKPESTFEFREASSEKTNLSINDAITAYNRSNTDDGLGEIVESEENLGEIIVNELEAASVDNSLNDRENLKNIIEEHADNSSKMVQNSDINGQPPFIYGQMPEIKDGKLVPVENNKELTPAEINLLKSNANTTYIKPDLNQFVNQNSNSLAEVSTNKESILSYYNLNNLKINPSLSSVSIKPEDFYPALAVYSSITNNDLSAIVNEYRNAENKQKYADDIALKLDAYYKGNSQNKVETTQKITIEDSINKVPNAESFYRSTSMPEIVEGKLVPIVDEDSEQPILNNSSELNEALNTYDTSEKQSTKNNEDIKVIEQTTSVEDISEQTSVVTIETILDNTSFESSLKRSVNGNISADLEKYKNSAVILNNGNNITPEKFNILKEYAKTNNENTKDVITKYRSLNDDERNVFSQTVQNALMYRYNQSNVKIENGKLIPPVNEPVSEKVIEELKENSEEKIVIKKNDDSPVIHPVIEKMTEKVNQSDIDDLFS